MDLVPADYRRFRAFRRHARQFLVLWGVVVCGLICWKAGFVWAIGVGQQELEQLRAERTQAIERMARAASLHTEAALLRHRLALLSGLRGGIDARRVLVAVDRALDGSVWFEDWRFRRAGEIVDREPLDTVETGYFVVVPLRDSERQKHKAWRMETHMEISAQAIDHSALADFVARLVEQPEIASVRVLSTNVRRYTRLQVVDFELAVVVNGRA